MKSVQVTMFEAYDGKRFTSKKSCTAYEHKNPPPPEDELAKKEKQLELCLKAIARHKKLDYEWWDDKDKLTWNCGKNHQDALAVYRAAKRDVEGGETRLEFLVRIGQAAANVLKFKEAEKLAVDDLMKVRAKRRKLSEEIEAIKQKLPKKEDKDGAVSQQS